jgi:hypothetical protein
MLADATMFAALDGSRPLSAGERRALESSPLTIRRFRVLALQRRTAMPAAANDAQWIGSSGMLRAAASGGPATIARLDTDDGCWTLDFIEDHRGTAASRGKGGWQVIVKLAPDAPFARRLLAEQTMLRVVDGTGAVIMQGRLDADGECEGRWPFESAPGAHFQSRGAGFTVEPLLQGRSSGVPRTPEGA